MKKIIAIALCSVCCGTAAAQKAYTLEQILDYSGFSSEVCNTYH